MGLENLGGGNVDNLRMNRENRTNPAEFAPSQEEDNFFDDDFSSSASDMNELESFSNFSNNDFGGGGGFDAFGQTNNMGMNNGFGQPNQMMQQPQTSQIQGKMEEAVFNALSGGAKGSFAFLKEFGYSLRMVTPKFWASWGSSTTITGLVVAGSGIILLFFKKHLGMSMIISGLLSSAIGFITLMFTLEKARQLPSRYVDGVDIDGVPQNINATPTEPPMINNNNNSDLGGFGNNNDNSFGDFNADANSFDNDDFDLEVFEEDEDEEAWVDEEGFNDDSIWDIEENSTENTTQNTVSTEQALEDFNNMDLQAGIYTRQFLYEQFTKVLKSFAPDYKKVKDYTPEDDLFIIVESLLGDCCETEGVSPDSLPTLEELHSSLFQIKLLFTTPPGVSQAKAEQIGRNFLELYAYKCDLDVRKLSIKVRKIAKHTEFTLFTGESAMISLLDTYNTDAKEFVLDTKNYMPIVTGVKEDGKLIMCDFKKVESMLIAGMPRSGKSWVAKLILAQMCAFVPPSELNLYICDPKAGISDFFSYTLPHVKKFASTDFEILNIMRYVVHDVAPKRKKKIGDVGLQTIWEYRELKPNDKMPLIYIVIDEVVTLADRMEKEIKDEFQGLLRELISQLPALGIRAILIPHVIKDQIISKTTTDLINCRISVLGDPSHIESTTGAKEKVFTQKLSNPGDMAVKMVTVDSDVMFGHAPVLCNDNPECNQLFAYMTQIWAKVEPEEYESSYHYKKAHGMPTEMTNNYAPTSTTTNEGNTTSSSASSTSVKPQRTDNPVIEEDTSVDVEVLEGANFNLNTDDIDISFATEPNRHGHSGFNVENVEDNDDGFFI